MLTDIFPWKVTVDPLAIAGDALWALSLYWFFYPLNQWLVEQLRRWFNFAERSLYWSTEEFERTRTAREAQNTFWASIFSIVPFLLVGGLCYYGLVLGLGKSWAVSLGIMGVIASGVYELGRRDSQSVDR